MSEKKSRVTTSVCNGLRLSASNRQLPVRVERFILSFLSVHDLGTLLSCTHDLRSAR